jgi:hypothetical protein
LGEIGTVRTRLYKVRLSELVMKLKERNSSAEMRHTGVQVRDDVAGGAGQGDDQGPW